MAIHLNIHLLIVASVYKNIYMVVNIYIYSIVEFRLKKAEPGNNYYKVTRYIIR